MRSLTPRTTILTIIAISVAVMVLLVAFLPVTSPAPPGFNKVVVTVHRVKALGPVDGGSDAADLYWRVTLGDITAMSPIPWTPNSDDISPDWEASWRLPSGDGQVYGLSIELSDDDGTAGYAECDVSPRQTAKAAVMDYEIDNNSWIGDSVSRYSYEVYHISGADDGCTSGDELDCELWFSVTTASEMPADNDGDGVADSVDLEPEHDLCIRISVDEVRELDPADSPGTADPYLMVLVGDGSASTDDGDAWEAEIWSHSVIPVGDDIPSGLYADSYQLWKNVPDDRRFVSVNIQLRDDDSYASGRDNPSSDGKDNACDDLLDVSRRAGGGDRDDPNGSVLHLTYDLIDQTWSGDDSTMGDDSSPGFSSGDEDGSADTDENDASIRFSIETASDVDRDDRSYLAEKYCPSLYFSRSELYYPVDVRAMLNQSTMVTDPGGALVSGAPVTDQMLSDHRIGSRLVQLTDEQASYSNTVYAHVFTSDNDRIVVQYWFFYLVDYHRLLRFDMMDHEGDWEGVTFIFPEDSWTAYIGGGIDELVPEEAGYSSHYEGQRMAWSGVQMNGRNPEVFVQEGGHASGFSGSQPVLKTYLPTVMWPSPWVDYAGSWGTTASSDHPSPPGPVYRCAKAGGSPLAYIWHEPLYWWTTLTWA